MFNCAVVNAGPLVALFLLDQLDLLPALYAECWYPKPFSMKCLWLGSASLGPSPCKVLIGLRAYGLARDTRGHRNNVIPVLA